METLPDFDALWDYDHPDQTEQKFRKILPAAQVSGDISYYAQLLTQIARTQGLQRRFDTAHETLDTVETLLEKADALTKIRYLLERGRVFNSSKQREKALPLFVQAWEDGRAVGEDNYAVDAAHMVAIAEAPENQLAWNMKAMAAAEQSRDERARNWLGSLYNNIGWTYHDVGQYTDALAMFEKTRTWHEQKGNTAALRIAKWCIGRTLRSLNRIDEALTMQLALAGEAAQTGESDGYVYEEIGECLLLLNRADEAKPYFAKAYAELSPDIWLAANEPARLVRLKSLGGA